MLDLMASYQDRGAPRFIRVNPSAGEPIALHGLDGLVAKEISFDRDEEIYGEGEPAEYLYCVRRGAVRTFKLLRDGRRQIDAFHLPGEYLGLSATQTHRLTAEAVVDSKVVIVQRKALESRAAQEADIACAMWKLAADNLRNAQDHMLLLGRKTAQERVASFLLKMVRRKEKLGKEAGTLTLPMTRADIADFLGLTIETVSRSFTNLRALGCIALDGAATVKIADRNELEELAEAAA